MDDLAVALFLLGIFLYVMEWSSEHPSVFRIGVFMLSVVEAALYMAFTA